MFFKFFLIRQISCINLSLELAIIEKKNANFLVTNRNFLATPFCHIQILRFFNFCFSKKVRKFAFSRSEMHLFNMHLFNMRFFLNKVLFLGGPSVSDDFAPESKSPKFSSFSSMLYWQYLTFGSKSKAKSE